MLYYILLWDSKSYASLTKQVSIAGLKSFNILFYYYSVFSTTTTTTLYPQLYQPIFSSSPPPTPKKNHLILPSRLSSDSSVYLSSISLSQPLILSRTLD